MKRRYRYTTGCNYCRNPARTVIKWTGWLLGRAVRSSAGACADHEQCVNFQSMRALHPEAIVTVRL